jgi:hypothetical protein
MTDANFRNTRLNVLAAMALAVVLVCAAVAVLVSDLNEYAKGIITLLLGRFSGYVDSVYNFEFGTTRSSKQKDDVIAGLAAPSPPQQPGGPK